jgi:2,3-dihydroxybenzoate decarboxylase
MEVDRRRFLQHSLTATAALATTAGAATRPQSSSTSLRRIAVEEGFNIPEIAAASPPLLAQRAKSEPGEAAIFGVGGYAPQGAVPGGPPPWVKQLGDLGEIRIRDMDAAGIALQVMLLSSPGVQIFDAPQAREFSQLANDRLAAAVRAHPTRFAGLAAIPPQDPAFAAKELERAVKSLGLRGAVINSHTHGEYLDDRKFWPILESAASLDVPIYIHPRAPSPQTVAPYIDYGLVGAIWGYAVEVSLHALRLIFAGVFDQFPRLRIIIGHMGEGIPFFLDRMDNHSQKGGGVGPKSAKLKRLPSEYFKDHFVITTSGMNWAPALALSLEVLGPDRILFAADYPFEDAPLAVRRIESIGLPQDTLIKLFSRNAERVFGLRPAV